MKTSFCCFSLRAGSLLIAWFSLIAVLGMFPLLFLLIEYKEQQLKASAEHQPLLPEKYRPKLNYKAAAGIFLTICGLAYRSIIILLNFPKPHTQYDKKSKRAKGLAKFGSMYLFLGWLLIIGIFGFFGLLYFSSNKNLQYDKFVLPVAAVGFTGIVLLYFGRVVKNYYNSILRVECNPHMVERCSVIELRNV